MMMDETQNEIRKRVVNSYLMRLILAGKCKLNKETKRPEYSTKDILDEIQKSGSEALRLSTKMDTHEFTLKECERALDHLLVGKQKLATTDIIAPNKQFAVVAEDEVKVKVKADDEAVEDENDDDDDEEEVEEGRNELKKKTCVKWSKRYEKDNNELAYFSYAYNTRSSAGDDSDSPLYVAERKKCKLGKQVIVKHVLQGKESYWGHNNNGEGTTTKVNPEKVKAFAHVLNPDIRSDSIITSKSMAGKRERGSGKLPSVVVAQPKSTAVPNSVDALLLPKKSSAPTKSGKATKIEQILAKGEEEEALDGVTEMEGLNSKKKQKSVSKRKEIVINEEKVKQKKKQRRNKVEDLGDHFAQVVWIGERIPQQSRLTSNRIYYEGFVKANVKYNVGDCIYLLPSSPSEPMYVAQIESCFEDNAGKWCECRWFSRAAELTGLGKNSLPYENFDKEREILLTHTVDKQPMTCIEGICLVFGSKKEADASKKTEEGGPNFEKLYCNWAYSVISTSSKKGKVRNIDFTKVKASKGKGFDLNASDGKKKKKA